MLSISYAQPHLSPISAASAQTFGTFYRGMDAVNWNPANLAYQYKNIQVATEVDTVYRIHILTTESEEQSDSIYVGHSITTLFTNDIKEILYEDSLYVNLQSLKEDSTFNLLDAKITNHTTADFYLRLMNDNGYSNTLIDTIFQSAEQIDQVEKYKHEKEKSSYLELLNMGFMLSNSSTDANWINTYILNGSDRGELDDAAKNEIISVFPDDGWRINPVINCKLGFRINNFALQVTPDVYGEFVIPRGLFELAFDGNEMSKPIDFSGCNNQFQAVFPVSISYGTKVNIFLLDNFINRSYVGVSAKYLAGLAYLESDIQTFIMQPTQNPSLNTDTVSMKAHVFTKYSLANAYMEIDTSKAFNYSFNTDHANQIPSGNGYAFDLGLIMDINEELSTSIAITNLLGKITWGNNTAYKHELKLDSQIAMEEETQVQMDSLLQAGIEIDTNIAVTSFKTKYPGALILGAEYSLDKIKLASNLKFGFSNEFGSSTKPRLSFATELNPIQWCSLLGGTSIGGYEGFQWGSGIRLRFLFLQMMFAYSEYGGMLKFAKGFSLSASASFVF